MNGHSIQAIDWALVITKIMRTEISNRTWPSIYLKPLRQSLMQILYELLIAYYETLWPWQIWPTIDEIMTELRDIARACGDQTLFGLIDGVLGTAYYITEQYEKSIRTLEPTLELALNDDQALMKLRILALDWTSLNEGKKFDEVATKAIKLIERGNFSDLQHVCMTWEGIGRGQGLLNSPKKAFDTLDKGWRIYDRIKSNNHQIPLRYVQLFRSELEVMRHLKLADPARLAAHRKESLRLADEHHYRRYARRIQNLLRWPGFN